MLALLSVKLLFLMTTLSWLTYIAPPVEGATLLVNSEFSIVMSLPSTEIAAPLPLLLLNLLLFITELEPSIYNAAP